MDRVVSLGSINVDRIRQLPRAEVLTIAERYEWFPAPGETVTVPELPADFSTESDSVRHGGKGANQAVAAAAAGASTELIGMVGPDAADVNVIDCLERAGVDTSAVGTTTVPTGSAYVYLAPDGENWIVVRPGANDAVDTTHVQEHYARVRSADCLLLQNEIPIEPAAALLEDLANEPDRPTVILDPGPIEGIAAFLSQEAIDYLVPNEAEYRALEDAIDTFGGTVIRTRGAEDVIVEGDQCFSITPLDVESVDTTGAGDVLNGFLAAELAAGTSLRAAIETATVAASLSIREVGARSAIPTLEEVGAHRTVTDRTT